MPLAQSHQKQEQPALELSQIPGVRILLVEDEIMVAESLQEGLTKRGAEVTYFDHPMQALQYIGENPEQVDVVLSDHGLPGMSGLELLGEVKLRYPRMHRILISGWGTNLEDTSEAHSAERILTKPVRVEDIVRTIIEKSHKPNRKRGGK